MAGEQVLVYSAARPRTARFAADTDIEGRYRLRLPPGEADFHMVAPHGFVVTPTGAGRQKMVIADGADSVAGPKFTLMRNKVMAGALHGVVVDARGTPVSQAEIIGLCRAGVCVRVAGQKATTDAKGRGRRQGI
jgi:hypothetical protein